jgi:hypothetical protein
MSEQIVANVTNPTETQTPPVPEAQPKEPQTQPPAQSDEMRAKFAALAKKERFARMQSQRVKQLETQIAERERQISEREKLWESEFKQSPLEALKRRGYSYEDLTKAALNDGRFDPATEVKEVRSELERLRQEQADKEKKAQEAQTVAQQQAEQEAIDTFKGKIGSFIESNTEKYELTKLFDASDLVFQTVEEHFSRTQKILSIDEACGLVEQYLEAEIDRTAKGSKKFQSKYGQASKSDAKDKSKSDVTLSNNLTSSSAPSLLSPATEADRIKRALAALG